MKIRALILSSILSLAAHAGAEVKLPAILGNHMVLQQGTANIWGWASPGKTLTVSLGSVKATAKVGSDGKWKTRLPGLKAGGPFEMTVSGDGTLTITDVLVGDVWMGSGQSNMEYELGRSEGGPAEVAQANFPQIRQFKLDHLVSFTPTEDVQGAWVTCSPSTAKDFTAVGYHFAKNLHKTLKVPVGLVVNAWGGSPAEAWTPRRALDKEPSLAALLKRWDADEKQISAWKNGGAFDLRIAELKLVPKDPKAKPVLLQLKNGVPGLGAQWSANAKPGSSAEFTVEEKGPKGETSGKFVGKMMGGGWGGFQTNLAPVQDLTSYESIQFKVKGSGGSFRLKLGQSSITDWNFYSTDIFSPPAEWQTVTYPLSGFKQGNWGTPKAFTPEAINLLSFTVEAPYWPDVAAIIYNAMAAPLSPLAMKGVVWYQGESNAGRANQYQVLLSAMIKSWREDWGVNFPFLVIQLPNYTARMPYPTESGWAELREAQLKTAQTLPGVGVVTTIELGEANDIHPKNKKDVGERAALWALSTVYGKANSYSVPVLDKAEVKGNKMVLTFKDVQGGLTVKGGGDLKGFAVAGPDRVFRWAQAKVTGKDTVEVSSPEVKEPEEVRYAWAENPDCNLFTKEGFPATPFRHRTKALGALPAEEIPEPPSN